jgi:hypothetical protein
VSSVPYWDGSCGETFAGAAQFPEALGRFMQRQAAGGYDPRGYILKHLELKAAAQAFVAHADAAARSA